MDTIGTITQADLDRLRAAREEADRRYNDALTAVDQASHAARAVPAPPPLPDETQVPPLNERWNVLEAPPALGWRGRLRSRLRHRAMQLLAPLFERQIAFNAALVDHVNRNIPVARETQQAIAATVVTVEEELRALATFQSRLIQYLQQITAYIDTKDYEAAGRTQRSIELLDHRTRALGAAISGVGDELAKRWESMVARETRYEARVTSLTAGHDELRNTLAIVQQATSTIKREIQRLERAGMTQEAPVGAAGAARAGAGAGTAASRESQVTSRSFDQAHASTIDSYKYVGFEDRFRGSQDDIRARLTEYLPFFEGASDVLDLGCGRGEFLDLLTEHGISCRGLDLNHEMVEVCRARGLAVDEGDALGFLHELPDGALGGLLAAQVVEHLQPDYLLALIDAAYQKLRPGSTIILETINPACWFAFFASYIRDITHVRPLHPDTLSYFTQASGFQRVRVRYRAPYPEHEKLQRIPEEGLIGHAFNANVEKLNGLLFTYLDYAVIAERM